MRHHLKLAAPLAPKFAVPLAIVAAVALSGCAQQGTSPGSGTSSSPPALSAPSSAPSSGSADCKSQLTIDVTDNGKTLCVAVGGTVTVDLGPNATSTDQPFDVTGTSLKAGSAEGTFAAVSPGTSVITTQRRNCPKPSPGSGMVACNSIQLWKVTVTVK
jgi:ABC-type Fe3+-hydroxamate transport system substrate-binding protein